MDLIKSYTLGVEHPEARRTTSSPERERLDEERLDEERPVEERLVEERLVEERLDEEGLEEEGLEEERLEEEGLEEEGLEEEGLEAEALEEERLEEERLEEERPVEERLEEESLDEEPRAALASLPQNKALASLTRDEYETGRRRRFGTANPEIQDIPFCNAMIEAVVDPRNAYKIIPKSIPDPDREWQPAARDPTWTFWNREGETETELPDGRVVCIAGEHEDWYDPDFCIYNDVVVINEDGTTTLYAYPRDIFPPTCHHTATLVGEYIYIIGGYKEDDDHDKCTTPVYRLDTRDFSISKVKMIGAPQPAYLREHEATLLEDGNIELTGGRVYGLKETKDNEGVTEKVLALVQNLDTYSLDIKKKEGSRSPAQVGEVVAKLASLRMLGQLRAALATYLGY